MVNQPAGSTTGIAPERNARRQLTAGSVGHFVEFFDFLVYSYLAIYFADQFFPTDSGSSLVPLLSAFGVFAVGFLARPIAGLVIGAFADRYGRRAAMTLTIGMMAAGSLLIALSPTYAQVGVLAPIVLVVARLLQGLSTGGEYSTAATFLVESAPPGKRGLYSSFLFVSSSFGKVAALGIVTLLVQLVGEDGMREFGWRIPFAIGALSAVVAWWIRRGTEETLDDAGGASRARRAGLFDAMRYHPKQSLQVFALTSGLTVGQYFWATYFPTYAAITTGTSTATTTVVSLIGLALYLPLSPLFGALSDRVGRKPVMYGFGAGMAVIPVPLIAWMDDGFVPMLAAQLIGILVLASGTAILGAVMAEMFPPRTRAAGFGFPYSLSVAVFGGTVSVIGTALEEAGAGGWFGWYLGATAVITLVATITLRETGGRDLERDA
jgi:MHS family alpha-ketoglutarate permease-like MFS transporter